MWHVLRFLYQVARKSIVTLTSDLITISQILLKDVKLGEQMFSRWKFLSITRQLAHLSLQPFLIERSLLISPDLSVRINLHKMSLDTCKLEFQMTCFRLYRIALLDSQLTVDKELFRRLDLNLNCKCANKLRSSVCLPKIVVFWKWASKH